MPKSTNGLHHIEVACYPGSNPKWEQVNLRSLSANCTVTVHPFYYEEWINKASLPCSPCDEQPRMPDFSEPIVRSLRLLKDLLLLWGDRT